MLWDFLMLFINWRRKNMSNTYVTLDEFMNEQGDYVWVMAEAYTINNKFPLGHGAKSIFFIQQFIKLSMEEIACIYWHMGAYNLDNNSYGELGQALEKHPLALALQEADMEASHMLEI